MLKAGLKMTVSDYKLFKNIFGEEQIKKYSCIFQILGVGS